VNALGVDGDTKDGVTDAVSFIEDLRQAEDLSNLQIGRNVVVIGGGMTAVDAAVQSKLLGAENVTIAYRRGREAMSASRYEQDLAASKGVRLQFNVQPKAILGNGAATEIELEYTASKDGKLSGTGETMRLTADQVFRAIGQTLTLENGPDLEGRKIAVDAPPRRPPTKSTMSAVPLRPDGAGWSGKRSALTALRWSTSTAPVTG